MQRQYRQICAKRNLTGNEFDKGVIDFDFSIGGKTVFVPSRSYFRIGVELTKPDGSPVDKTDNVA